MDRFKGKTVIVTGASSGIGEAAVRYFVHEGAELVLAARDESKMQLIVRDMPAAQVHIVRTDVSVESDCAHLIQSTLERFGKIDVLVNNAGLSMRASFADSNLDVIRRLMDVNFWGTVYCTHYAIQELIRTKGSVVGVSSIAGYKGLPGRTGYSASKFAMNGFLESLRLENRATGLHVLTLAPGFVSTNIRNTALTSDGSVQAESPRAESEMMRPEEVAEKMGAAILQRKAELVLSGQGKLTVNLNKAFPRLVDGLVYNHMKKEPGAPFK